MTLLGAGTALSQQPVLAGLDLLETDPSQIFEDLSNLDVLCPGCSVLGDPVIPMRGIPLEQDPSCPGADLGSTDTILRRLQDTPPLFPGQDAQVEIEIVQLHLQSVQPFRVDCGGQIQNWMLDITITDPVQPIGQIFIMKDDPNGGTFDAILPVTPRLTFTRIDDCPPTVVCEVDGPVVNFNVGQAPWAHHSMQFPVLEIPGCTSNFIAGVNPGPSPRTGPGFLLAASPTHGHYMLPVPPPKIFQNTWQEAVHFTFDLANSGGKLGTPIDALRLFNPRWIPPDPPGALPDTTVYFKSNSICNTDSLWTTAPTSWCRVNWDSTSALFRDETWWFFPPTVVDELAPAMDVVFSLPDSTVCPIPSPGAWYEVDCECYF